MQRSSALIAGRRRDSSSSLVVAAFLVEREEAVELDDLAGGAELQRAGPAFAVMSTVVRSSSADSIWLAMVRFQISS